MITISIVSHLQAALVAGLLRDIESHCKSPPARVILTLNVEEPLGFRPDDFSFSLEIIRNPARRGFGANHNAAFRRATGRYFCVLNPDVRFSGNPFPSLLKAIADESVGAVSALVLDPEGAIEDHARRFPRVATVLRKALPGSRQDYPDLGRAARSVEWIAGMFMLFRSAVFREVGGFDERYFLYYEDVDLCARLRAAGYDIRVEPAARVVHDARRESRRNVRRMARHLISMARYLFTRPRSLPPLG
ncbi:MAG: glycosyltransferase family 2 protein [Burkholderiales bacterium]